MSWQCHDNENIMSRPIEINLIGQYATKYYELKRTMRT